MRIMTHDVFEMSLLGPDDFGLSKKERKKKLAKDLSPALQKTIEQWLDREEDSDTFEHISDLVGPDEARRLIAQRRALLKRRAMRDPLMEEE